MKPPDVLYHFTSRMHWERIRHNGFLKVVESDLSPFKTHAGPDVVWLTTATEPAQEWQRGSAVFKGEVRFTIAIRRDRIRAQWWPSWSRAHGVLLGWYRRLDQAGGGRSHEWWVVEAPILRASWLEVVDTQTGEDLLRQEEEPAREERSQ